MEVSEGLTFDDVLLEPQYSTINSRSEVSLESWFSRNIKLNSPLVSAPMSSVTEATLAIALAREGGIGCIHRNLPVQIQAREVAKVKRDENIIIDKPFSVGPEEVIETAIDKMRAWGVGSAVVVDSSNRLVGMLTQRDLLFETNHKKLVREAMTSDPVTALHTTTTSEQVALMKQKKIEKLPLVDADGKLMGMVAVKDALKKKLYPLATRDGRGKLRVAAAVGIRGDYQERTRALVDAGVDAIIIDVAHGHLNKVLEVTKWMKQEFNGRGVDIVAGNIATAHAARDLIAAGADSLRVGIGPGATCITRVVAGVGVPQLTAIMNCASEANQKDVPLIGDGGIRTSGDAVKALAAGSSSIMSGYIFAGTDESPGRVLTKGGRRYKSYYGMASWTANQFAEDNKNKVPEGVEASVPYRGPMKEITTQFLGGIRSGMSYSNARTVKELWKNARFIKMTSSGLRESHSHDLEN